MSDRDMVDEFEQHHAWARGWRDAACGRPFDSRYVHHRRGDMRLAYLRGREEGAQAWKEADARAKADTGYRPNLYRDSPLDPVVAEDIQAFEDADTGEYPVLSGES
jgi:hypothetical protein